jgi:hypothetical protein
LNINKEIIFFLNEHFHQIDENKLWVKHDAKNFILESNHDDVDVYIDTINFTIIPDELFYQISESQKRDFITSNHSEFRFFNQTIPNLSGQLFWCAKKQDVELIKNKIPNCNLNQLIKPILINDKSSELKYYISNKFIYISSFEEGTLKIANRFLINNDDDALYFILNSIKESNLINSNFKFSAHGLNREKLVSKLKSIFPNNKYILHKENDLNSIFK